ncbi:MAG: histidine phosphatase family protein [Beijerinckiaceae bacterium]
MVALVVPTLFFIRHGETDWNAEGRLQGQRDIPLNDLGRVQAAEAGVLLKKLHVQPDDLDWWVSPLFRTRETAELARDAIGLHPPYYKTDARLKELTFGRWEGMTWKEVRRTDPAGASRREKDKWAAVPPDGESYAMLIERVLPFLSELRRESVLVSHGGVARVLMHMLAGKTPQDSARQDIWQGKVLLFQNGTCRWIG